MRRRAALLLALGAFAACSDSAVPPPQGDPPYVPPPESCEPSNLDDPGAFRHCSLGSGVFGTWVVDDLGLPAYEYGLDQHADPRAAWLNTEGLDRRDHWGAFGNGRVNGFASNEGWVEVVTQDRGPTYLNKMDEASGAFAGGFSYVDDGEVSFCSAYRWRPEGTRTRRRFGASYAEAMTEYAGIAVERRTFAPAGDAPAVIAEVTITNRAATPRTLRHYEVWDVARRHVEINWAVSGMPFTLAPRAAADARDARNALFDEEVAYDPAARLLGLRRTHAADASPPPPGEPNDVDYYPGDPYLAALIGEVSDVFTDQAAFFGGGGLAAPSAVASRASGEGIAAGTKGARRSGLGQPRMLALRSDLALGPGERRTLRFAYGYSPMGEPWAVDPAWRDPARDLRAEQAAALRPHLVEIAADRDPVLTREMAWHAAQIEASVGRRDYWQGHVVPQGSAYLYLHGADGAARDLGLFALPLVYTHPVLAKEELLLHMGLQHADDHRFAYAFQGHGRLDDALGLHEEPSDLDLFFVWALAEYLGATGDLAFLDEPAPYWPREALPAATGWDHLRDSLRHLFDVIGTGEHGLIRITTGDWSDGIVFEAPDRDLAIVAGESVPNTQMAVAVLPRVADLVEARDAALAAEIRARVAAMREALAPTWTGSFFGRAYFGDGNLAYADRINLESQVWALVGDTFAAPGDRERLVAAIRAELDDPSPAGATLVPGGQVWPAISGLLTWGYAQSDPELAWRHLVRNTMAAHAVAYPEVWYGIWTGPDGLNGPGDRPGETWFSPVTPMTDFPAMNNNQHAMPLFAMLRVAGLEATARGLRVAPRVPGRSFTLRTALCDVAQRGATIRGTYRPTGASARVLSVAAPPGEIVVSASLDGVPVTVGPGATSIDLDLAAAPGSAAFEVVTAPSD